jgi:isoleucyl-tRNA synthetase
MSTDYKSTIFLPQTDFPMRGGLAEREPETLRRWDEIDLYARLRSDSEGRKKFILHDGPPYANGHLHMGHALNKILKDVINRTQQMLGKDANYVPGWDCHGLPIEWKIEEQYRADGRDKDAVPVLDFRRECRQFAEHWIGVQTEEFKRLGVIGDWKNPYTTMAYAAEAQIIREIGKFILNGSLYRGARPVLWSVAEKTALADAEVEYHDHTSTTIWVRFPVTEPSRPELKDCAAVIWTTTPWTIPGNRAIAYAAEERYVVIQVADVAEKSNATPGERLLIAESLSDSFLTDCGIVERRVIAELSGADLAGAKASHPLRGHGYDFDVPLFAADFVTMEQGTGLVHIAPGHGADDYELGVRNGLQVPSTVDADGRFVETVPLFAGRLVYREDGKRGDADVAVCEALEEFGALIARGRLTHSYPHSWRSKVPLIFRNTPQWFISMDATGLRDKALQSIERTRFVPPQGRNRLYSMIEQRPDWCVSRQRLWGVPLPIFIEKKSGDPLRDQSVIDRIAEIFEKEGGDAWFGGDPGRFLGPEYRVEDYEQVMDVVEVWFDSGSTHSYVLEARPELNWPADLYLEGSDQHRGWFHTSLLESAGTRGRAPYDAVLTHGFVLDEQGRKMSKSLGNVISPQDIVSQQGADILRIWVVASNYEEDLRIGREILRYQADAYRRLRNTLRYLLGNLHGFEETERLPPAEMPELDRWVLHRLWELDRQIRKNIDDYDFHRMFQAIHNFCAVDLSAFYFDVRKDSLYCNDRHSNERRACRTVLDAIFDHLTAWLAPILCFTAEEAWWRRGKGPEESVHLRVFPSVPDAWRDDALSEKWAKIREVRRVVTGALERAREQKRIGSSLQADPAVHIAWPFESLFEGIDMAEVCITSGLRLLAGEGPRTAYRLEDVEGVAVDVGLAEGDKCQRCWRVLPDVGAVAEAPDTCGRCARVVLELQAAAE